jgi:ABC-type cobalt transport system substrate-binding protein
LQKHEPTKKEQFIEGLSSFLQKNRTALLVTLIVIVAAIIIVGVYLEVRESRTEKSTNLMHAIEEDYTAWFNKLDPESEEPDPIC